MKDKLTQLKKRIYKKYSPEIKLKKQVKKEKKSIENFNIIPNQIDLNLEEKTFKFSRNRRKYFIMFILLLVGLNVLSFVSNYYKENKLQTKEHYLKLTELQKISKERKEYEKQLQQLNSELEKSKKELELKNKKIEKLKIINKSDKIEKIKEILNN